jgi:hypothetical protein
VIGYLILLFLCGWSANFSKGGAGSAYDKDSDKWMLGSAAGFIIVGCFFLGMSAIPTGILGLFIGYMIFNYESL